MQKKIFIIIQRILPHHALTRLLGYLAESRVPWIKNLFIKIFMRCYSVDLSEAIIKNPTEFACFNDFFIRQLEPSSRPIVASENSIACPVDGSVSQIGEISQQQLLQAKGHFFSLDALLGNEQDAQLFINGSFSTLYLAPHNYHRIHMPIAGKLLKTSYIPGKLFSVNNTTAENIPGLFSQNERLVCLFETAVGPMAVILVGAMIVGSIQTAWMTRPIRFNHKLSQAYGNGMTFNKGDELGYFKLGSTVILLFPQNKCDWQASMERHQVVKMGQLLGSIKN